MTRTPPRPTLFPYTPPSRSPPILRTVASRESDNGVEEVLAKVAAHRDWLESSGEGHRRRSERSAREVEAIALASLRARTRSEEHTSELQSRQYLVCRLLLEK